VKDFPGRRRGQARFARMTNIKFVPLSENRIAQFRIAFSKHFFLAAVLLLAYFMACKNPDGNNPIAVIVLNQGEILVTKSLKL
jgi:hypothetical protein